MGLLELAVLGAVAAAGAVAALVAVLASRGRTRRNRVVPEVATDAPASWAGTHTPEARLHRRLRDAVLAGRAVPDPDGSLIAARVEIERSALAIDAHLVALSRLAERERAGRLPEVEAAVASIELAVARLSDTARHGTGAANAAVEAALDRIRLLDEARAELDRDPLDVLSELPTPTPDPAPTPTPGPPPEQDPDVTPDEPPAPRPMPG